MLSVKKKIIMLKIDKKIFAYNLNLTQQYCRVQQHKIEADPAKVFRSFNPMHKSRPLFSFQVNEYSFEIKPGLNTCTIAKWLFDPVGMGCKKLVDRLFAQQITHKAAVVDFYNQQIDEGEILVAEFDDTVMDGASEVASLGFIDLYDLPPIDTWFYLMKHQNTRILFAWIPTTFKQLVQEAIEVNCLDLLKWFRDFSPKDYSDLFGKDA